MEFNLDTLRPALLLLDMQELFTSADGPFANTGSAELIIRVNAFSDWSAKTGLPLIYSRYVLSDDLSDAGLLRDNPVVQQGCFRESSPWMEWDQRLEIRKNATHLQRNRPGAFCNGSLEAALENSGADALLLCGLSVNNAISTTAREAFARDIPAIVVKDCCGAAPFEKDLEKYFEILHTWTAEVASADQLKQRLGH